jgi:putative transposase
MARLPRLVLPGIPYHVTQRGNRREQTFFEEGDYAFYRALLAEAAGKAGTEIWCYCLMPNHVHLIAVPSDADGLRRTFADAHRRYTGFINARHKWTGHLWQGRFGAVAMDETHLAHAMRYVSLNPVRARLSAGPEGWFWSSARAHFAGEDDELVRVAPAIDRYGDFAAFLGDPVDWRAPAASSPRASAGQSRERQNLVNCHRNLQIRLPASGGDNNRYNAMRKELGNEDVSCAMIQERTG